MGGTDIVPASGDDDNEELRRFIEALVGDDPVEADKATKDLTNKIRREQGKEEL